MSVTSWSAGPGSPFWTGSPLRDDRYPDPYDDVAARRAPKSLAEAHRYTEVIWANDGTYRQAMRNVAAYFVTGVTLASPLGGGEVSREERDKYQGFLDDRLKINREGLAFAENLLWYGEAAVSVMLPIRRYLACPECKTMAPLRRIAEHPRWQFRFENFQFHGTCRCGYRGPLRRLDRRDDPTRAIKIKHWSPDEIRVEHDEYSGQARHLWKIPQRYRTRVEQGDLLTLEQADWRVVEAIRDHKDIEFAPGVLLFVQLPSLAGVRTGGRGLPNPVMNFRQALYTQSLRRMNEVIANEFILPWRVMTPSARGGASEASADPLVGLSLGLFKQHVLAMYQRRRKDPGQMNFLPVPIEHHSFGAEGNQLASYQLLDQAEAQELNASGVPVEMYRGNLSLQSAPAAMRLFESRFSHLVAEMNTFVQFVVDRMSELMDWEPVSARWNKPSHADDLNRQMARLQLMMQRGISQSSGLESLGLTFEDEAQRMAEEESFLTELQQRAQERLQAQLSLRSLAQGQPPPQPAAPGGDPMAGGGDPMAGGGMPPPQPPQTPEQLWSEAQTIATELMGLPDTQRRSYLMRIKQESPALHASIKQQINDLENRADAAGGAMLTAQAFGKQGRARFARIARPTAWFHVREACLPGATMTRGRRPNPQTPS